MKPIGTDKVGVALTMERREAYLALRLKLQREPSIREIGKVWGYSSSATAHGMLKRVRMLGFPVLREQIMERRWESLRRGMMEGIRARLHG